MSQRKNARQRGNSRTDSSSAQRATIYEVAVNAGAFLVLAAIIGAVYATAIDGPFIYDDSNSIQFNPSIVRLFPLLGDSTARGPLNPPAEISTSGRPLVNLSLALNYHFGQFHTRGYHVTNVVLHVASAFLLWGLARARCTCHTSRADSRPPPIHWHSAWRFCGPCTRYRPRRSSMSRSARN